MDSIAAQQNVIQLYWIIILHIDINKTYLHVKRYFRTQLLLSEPAADVLVNHSCYLLFPKQVHSKGSGFLKLDCESLKEKS